MDRKEFVKRQANVDVLVKQMIEAIGVGNVLILLLDTCIASLSEKSWKEMSKALCTSMLYSDKVSGTPRSVLIMKRLEELQTAYKIENLKNTLET